MQPTDEQQAAVDTAVEGHSLALEALAGTGKSSTLKLIAAALPARTRVLLTAFSAQVIKDAKAANFPRNVKPMGNHGMAYRPVGVKYREAGRMERRLTPRAVVECLGLEDRHFPGDVTAQEGAHIALEAVLRFQQSAAQRLTPGHVLVPESLRLTSAEIPGVAFKLAQRIWDELANIESRLPITHDTYLKLWALTDPRLEFDTVMCDEAQDSNAVMIDLLTRQNAQMIVVGDRRQQIFSFRGAENAMGKFKVTRRLALTQSFRFGTRIAEAANAVLLTHCKSDLRLRGFDRIDDRLTRFPIDRCTIVARKNTTLIGHVVSATAERKRIGVVGGVTDLLKLVEGAEKLMRNERAVQCPDLADFRTWGEVKGYAQTPAGRDLSVLANLVDEYGAGGLQRLLRSVEGNEVEEGRCDLLLTTAHRSKGREWDSVLLADDFPVPTDSDLGEGPPEGRTKWNLEEGNLLYVAVTRGQRLVNCLDTEAWLDALDRAEVKGVSLPGVLDDPQLAAEIAGEGDGAPVSPSRQAIAQADPAELIRQLLYAAEAGRLDADLRARAMQFLASI